MEVLHLILTIIQVLAAVGLVAIVMLQSGKSAGLSGAIAGSSESFMSKNKSSTLDGKLAKLTKWIAVVFLVLTFVLNLFYGLLGNSVAAGQSPSRFFAVARRWRERPCETGGVGVYWPWKMCCKR